MELDQFLDSQCLECAAAIFIEFVAERIGRRCLLLAKFLGIVLDVVTVIMIVAYPWDTQNQGNPAFVLALIVSDRVGALLLLCIYGRKPTKAYQQYAYYKANEGGDDRDSDTIEKGLISLYYGSMFSGLDFMGRIFISYAFVVKVANDDDDDDVGDKQEMQQQIEMGFTGNSITATDNDAKKANNDAKKANNEEDAPPARTRGSCCTCWFAVFYFSMIGCFAMALLWFIALESLHDTTDETTDETTDAPTDETTDALIPETGYEVIFIVINFFFMIMGIGQHICFIGTVAKERMMERNSCCSFTFCCANFWRWFFFFTGFAWVAGSSYLMVTFMFLT